jgi:hypothetical protein
VKFRRKRPVMIAMDLTRLAALMSIPAAYTLDRHTVVRPPLGGAAHDAQRQPARRAPAAGRSGFT